MTKNNFVEEEGMGVEAVPKKEKKKKSPEEKEKDRKVVFWVLLIVVAMTVAFWLKALISSGGFGTQSVKIEDSETDDELREDNEPIESDGFFVKYDI